MTFKLEAFDPDEVLPQNVRLDGPENLIGHKIVAVVEDCAGRKAGGGELLIVTETGCWLILAPGDDGESPQIVTERGKSWASTETISDYATAIQMLQAGLITNAQYDYLRAEEKKREDEKKARRAAALRAELKKLEGSA